MCCQCYGGNIGGRKKGFGQKHFHFTSIFCKVAELNPFYPDIVFGQTAGADASLYHRKTPWLLTTITIYICMFSINLIIIANSSILNGLKLLDN